MQKKVDINFQFIIKMQQYFIKHLFDVADSQSADIVRGSFRDFEGNITQRMDFRLYNRPKIRVKCIK